MKKKRHKEPKDEPTNPISEEISGYEQFALSKNMVGMAIALVLSTSVQKVVNSISENIFMPVIKFFTSTAEGSWVNWHIALCPGLDIGIGKLVSSVLEFFITTVILYLCYSRLKKVDPSIDVTSKP